VQSAGFSCGVTILSELASAGGVQPVSLHNPLYQVPVTKCQPLSIGTPDATQIKHIIYVSHSLSCPPVSLYITASDEVIMSKF
jgi:hypothetical protein